MQDSESKKRSSWKKTENESATSIHYVSYFYALIIRYSFHWTYFEQIYI